MDERQVPAPAGGEDADAGRRRDDVDTAVASRPPLGIAAGRPAQELGTEDEPRLTAEHDERSSGKLAQLRLVQAPALGMEPIVELVRRAAPVSARKLR